MRYANSGRKPHSSHTVRVITAFTDTSRADVLDVHQRRLDWFALYMR